MNSHGTTQIQASDRKGGTWTPEACAPLHCTCVQCEAFYRLRRLRTEKARTLAEWVANGPEEHRAARERVREIIGL